MQRCKYDGGVDVLMRFRYRGGAEKVQRRCRNAEVLMQVQVQEVLWCIGAGDVEVEVQEVQMRWRCRGVEVYV